MKSKLSIAVSTALLTSALTLSGCSNDSDAPATSAQKAPATQVSAQAHPLLKFIPADAPYYFASTQVPSAEEAFEIIRRTGSLDDLSQARADLEFLRDSNGDPGLATLLELGLAVLAELEQIDSVADYHALGLKPNAQSALYALGILPALRLELHDEALFTQLVERVMAQAELELPEAAYEGYRYWRVADDYSPIEGVFAIGHGQLLLTLLPVDADAELKALMFGAQLPARSMVTSGTLGELEQRHRFTPYGSGMVDFSRLLNELSQPGHAATRAFFTALEESPLDLADCAQDVDRLTTNFPGLVLGMRAYSPERIEVNGILATSDEIASDIRSFSAGVPGLGSTRGMASMGLGLNIPALLKAAQGYAESVRSNPFTCDGLQDINEAFTDLTLLTGNPMAMMFGPAISGLKLRLDSLKLSGDMPEGSGVVTLSSPDAQALLRAGAQFLPPLAALNLSANSEVKAVPADLLPPGAPDLHAAMSANAIVIGAGLANPASLKDELSARVDDRGLLFHAHVSDSFYTALIPLLEENPFMQDEHFNVDMLRQHADRFSNTELWLGADPHGLELSIGIDMKP